MNVDYSILNFLNLKPGNHEVIYSYLKSQLRQILKHSPPQYLSGNDTITK